MNFFSFISLATVTKIMLASSYQLVAAFHVLRNKTKKARVWASIVAYNLYSNWRSLDPLPSGPALLLLKTLLLCARHHTVLQVRTISFHPLNFLQRTGANKKIDRYNLVQGGLKVPQSIISSWKPKKAVGVVQKPENQSAYCGFQARFEGLRTSSTKGRRRSVFQVKRSGREGIPPSPAFLFSSGPQWDDGHPRGECHLLGSVQIRMLVSSRNSLTDTPRNHI